MTHTTTAKPNLPDDSTQLKRVLNLPLLVLYGLGTTIGAGIYVLVGAAAGWAGLYAPLSFVLAAIAIAPTAASYGELVSRFPVSAGEAAYVREGLRSKSVSAVIGWLVILSGIVASATVAIGCAGYLRTFIDLPLPLVVTAVVVVVGVVAAWGIMESVLIAALFTLIEAGGLLILVWAGLSNETSPMVQMPSMLPPLDDLVIWAGIANAGLLAVFAFIGFEDMVNVAEETKRPHITVPLAILATLLITTLLYFAVTLIAVTTVPPEELAGSEAPLSLVFERLTGMSPATISAIAIFATLNTILVQMIMASRVIYGMAEQQTMPQAFRQISEVTKTPVRATVAVGALTLVLALGFPLDALAQGTSQIVLLVWVATNTALIMLKIRVPDPGIHGFKVPMAVPVAGLVLSAGLLIVTNLV
ncbi:MAG: amino acid permease [Rhizobiaceae bacterium]